MFNVNKLFPKLSIRSKLLIAFCGLSFLPLVLVGMYSIYSNATMMRTRVLEELIGDVRNIKEKTFNFLDDVSSDLHVMQHSSSIQSWIQAEHLSSQSKTSATLAHVGDDLVTFARTKGIYYQVRLITESGDEALRVECINPNDSLSEYRITLSEKLPQSRQSFYPMLVKNLQPNQLTFLQAEVVHGDDNLIPVMSFAAPLFYKDQRVGVLVANIYERSFIDVIETKHTLTPARTVVLVTMDGHYVYHSNKKKDWNKFLATRQEDNLQKDYSAPVVSAILSNTEGTIVQRAGDIIAYAPLFSSTTTAHLNNNALFFAEPVIVFFSISEHAIMGPVRSFTWTFAILLMLFLLCAIGLGLLATVQFTRPIAELQHGAEVIASGHYENRLHVETHDEIEHLAKQFNVMAESLEAHEHEIQQHRTHLESMVLQRTSELTEEKAKLQAVLDNVPSALVLLDADLYIHTVSTAFSSLTDISAENVSGQFLSDFFIGSDGHAGAICRKALRDGTIEAAVSELHLDERETRYLEYIAVPMKEQGRTMSLLLIITDITKRKRLEQQLVSTEKLVAAGEMSSIIAHEFRNALTSVKMIIQLFAEGKHISSSEKKSLAVALNSIEHMESIVQELLSFAKPKLTNLSLGNLNQVIEESVQFVRPHIKSKNIQLDIKLDRSLQLISLDVSLMKEAFINLLLNAIQALDGQDGSDKKKLQLFSKKVRLRSSILPQGNDYSTSGVRVTENATRTGIPKNTICALVELQDTGSGIPSLILNRIFDPFFTTKTNGTGLGLPMVQRTIGSHHGVITVESREGKGTTFRIYLPYNHET